MTYQQPPPPYYQPQPPQRRRRHRGLKITAGITGGLVALFVVIGIISAATGAGKPASSTGTGAGADTPAPAVATSSAAPAAASGPGIGQVARDGDFAFTVQSISCGPAAAAAVEGSDGIGETIAASAKECIVTMKVTDDKGTAQTFFDGNQYAYDAAGRQLSADSNASVYLQGDQDATQVNPGVTIVARVPFQIPSKDEIVRLVLHDSAFSDGVSVRA